MLVLSEGAACILVVARPPACASSAHRARLGKRRTQARATVTGLVTLVSGCSGTALTSHHLGASRATVTGGEIGDRRHLALGPRLCQVQVRPVGRHPYY